MTPDERAAEEHGAVLVAMTPAEFDEMMTALVPAYAADKVAAGQWSEDEALDLSRKIMAEILPQGAATPDHAFYTIRDRDGRTVVGALWTFEKPQAGRRVVHIYDIEIAPEHRRRGHARRAIEAVESRARARGLAGIALHVFGHNTGARALYEELGFETKGVQMFKPLERAMSPEVLVREETPEDRDAIRRIHDAAFGQPAESTLVERLRENGAILLSLVAVVEGRAVGHALYSPVRLGDADLTLEGAGLGPMSVLPEFQRAGIGWRLVAEGNRRMRERGCPFIVVLGHPEYYPRFGFEPASGHGIRCEWNVPDEVFMVLPLDPARLTGRGGLARYRREFETVA